MLQFSVEMEGQVVHCTIWQMLKITCVFPAYRKSASCAENTHCVLFSVNAWKLYTIPDIPNVTLVLQTHSLSLSLLRWKCRSWTFKLASCGLCTFFSQTSGTDQIYMRLDICGLWANFWSLFSMLLQQRWTEALSSKKVQ